MNAHARLALAFSLTALLGCGGKIGNSDDVAEDALSGCPSVTPAAASASASEASHPPALALDDDRHTAWVSSGAPASLTLDLGRPSTLCGFRAVWYQGASQVTTFSLSASADGRAFTRFYQGASSGSTSGSESYRFTDVAARYLRVDISAPVGKEVGVSEALTRVRASATTVPDAGSPNSDAGTVVPPHDAGTPPPANSDGGTSAPAPASCSKAGKRDVAVSSADGLTAALAAAQPGDRILLANGVYGGTFVATTSGTAASPIALCGSRQAILQGDKIKSGYGFHLQGSHWLLAGFSVTGSEKGIILDGANDNLLDGLEVYGVGQEGIHLREFSSRNVVQHVFVHDTGKLGGKDEGYGEGVYLGTATSNWCTYTNCQPDLSNDNQVLDSVIGPNVTAESIDIKEATVGGIIRGNTFDGTGMSGTNYADSFLDVKGSNYLISENHGSHSLNDGFQTHVPVDGAGQNNRFEKNVFTDVPGYGINVVKDSLGTVVTCDNTITGGLGLSNLTCSN